MYYQNFYTLAKCTKRSLVAQWVKDPALLQLWFGSAVGVAKKRKKKKKHNQKSPLEFEYQKKKKEKKIIPAGL